MLLRICLFIAILGGLAAGGLGFVKVKEKITTLQAHDQEQFDGRKKAETDLASTRKDLDKTKTELAQTNALLVATTEQRDKAVAEAAAATKNAEKLTADLNKTRTERDNAQSELAAYKTTGYNPEQIVGMGNAYKALEAALEGQKGENKILGQKLKKTEAELATYKSPDVPVYLPPGLAGKVLVTDPKYNFVVLNVGEDQGVIERGQLLVNRNGRLVAKVKVTSVQKDRSVANVMPGWELGEVTEGDLVIPAYPGS
jgi:hypothetical protein